MPLPFILRCTDFSYNCSTVKLNKGISRLKSLENINKQIEIRSISGLDRHHTQIQPQTNECQVGYGSLNNTLDLDPNPTHKMIDRVWAKSLNQLPHRS